MQKIAFKKRMLREMLIEQIFEFELRGRGPPGRTYTPTADYFHDKTKPAKKIVEWVITHC